MVQRHGLLAQAEEERRCGLGSLRLNREGAAVEDVRFGAAGGCGDLGEPAILFLAAGDLLRAFQPELGGDRREARFAAQDLIGCVSLPPLHGFVGLVTLPAEFLEQREAASLPYLGREPVSR